MFHFSADDRRIGLQKANDGSCKLMINGVNSNDNGEWILTIEHGKGSDKKLHEYQHHVSVKMNVTLLAGKI